MTAAFALSIRPLLAMMMPPFCMCPKVAAASLQAGLPQVALPKVDLTASASAKSGGAGAGATKKGGLLGGLF